MRRDLFEIEKKKNQYLGSNIRLRRVFTEEVVNLGGMGKQTHQGQHRSWCSFPCSLFDCRDYSGRWKIREDCLKWLAALLKEWPRVLPKLILSGGQMHLLSYIGLIRLINQSLPHPPIRFCRGYFYEMSYRRSVNFFLITDDRRFDMHCYKMGRPFLALRSMMVMGGWGGGGGNPIFWGCCWRILFSVQNMQVLAKKKPNTVII